MYCFRSMEMAVRLFLRILHSGDRPGFIKAPQNRLPKRCRFKRKISTPEKLSFEERKELKRISQKIEKAEAKVATAKQALQDPAIQSDGPELLARTKTEEEVVSFYTRWEDLEARDL